MSESELSVAYAIIDRLTLAPMFQLCQMPDAGCRGEEVLAGAGEYAGGGSAAVLFQAELAIWRSSQS